MHTILLPFDGSDSAMRAVDYLIDFSATLGDVTVHVVNVQVEPRLFGGYLSPAMLEQLHAGALDYAAETNAKAADRLRSANLGVQSHGIIGEVVSELIEATRKFECTMIVMGTRGMGSFGSMVLGSVASKVVHEAPVPVLLVK